MRHVLNGSLPYSAKVLEDSRSAIQAVARRWSFFLEAASADRVLLYFRLLLDWNQRVNLTGATSMTALLNDHLPDSFALSGFVPSGADVLDVGSGGGLPALPLSIIRPDCAVTLLEPRAKRTAFLNAAVRQCKCQNARVIRGRFEDLDCPRFSVATSRAAFAPAEWLERGVAALAPGGRLVLLSTVEVIPCAGALRLVDMTAYRTGSGSSRWAGCFCST